MAQSLVDILGQIRGGAALNDASRELAELIRAVKEVGKKGKLTLTIEVEPDKTDATVVTFQPEVTVKTPKRAYAKGIFYIDERTGSVSREDPRQMEMELERQSKLAEAGATALSQVGRG